MKRIFVLSLFFITILGVMGQALNQEPVTITLDPVADINPVKTQHTIVATVLDAQGQPLPQQRVEWILARGPNAVGDIVDHAGKDKAVKKLGNHYTVTYTNSSEEIIDKGTADPEDDVTIKPGQTWITFTSPLEGETHVIAFCPAIKNANKHKTFAVKYWFDAKIEWPENAINKVGTPHTFKFKITKASTNAALPNYQIKWQLLPEGPAAYLGSNQNTQMLETKTDQTGLTSIVLNQVKPAEGKNKIKLELYDPITNKLLATRFVIKTWLSPQLTLEKTGPEEGILGEDVVYHVTITNPGDTEANEVIAVDTLPNGLDYVDATIKPTNIQGKILTWNLGTIPKDGSVKFSMTLKAVQVSAPNQPWEQTIKAHSQQTKEVVSTVLTKIGAPELFIVKSGPPELRKDQKGTYTLTVKNNGDAPAKQVEILDRIPSGMQYGQRDFNRPLDLKWKVGTLARNGGSKTYKYTLNAPQTGTFTNVARAILQGRQVHRAKVVTRVISPILTLKKEGIRVVKLDRIAPFTITVTNSGDADAKDLVLVDTLPKQLEYVSDDQNGIFRAAPKDSDELDTITWRIASLAPNKSFVIKLNTKAVETTQNCVNVVKLRCESDVPPKIEPLVAKWEMLIRGVAAMHINSYDTNDPVEVGQQTIYVIDARNEGTSACTNVKMATHVDPEMKILSAEGPTKYRIEGQKVYFDPHPILPPGEKLTYQIHCEAIREGSAKNTATLTYDQFPKPIIDEEGTTLYK